MKTSIFKTFFLSLCIIANTSMLHAQTASILPQGKTQFLDNSGKPLTSGTVDFYIPSTTTRKTTWQNSGETVANTNPVVLDAGGRAIIYGEGTYRQVVKDRLGNVIWDQLTSSTGSGSSSPTATGDGDLVGTIKPWAGMTAPNQYAFTYGQEISRTTYATLFTAITSSQATFCTSASPILTGLTDTTNFWIGMSLEVSCVAAGFSTVVSKTSTTVTMAANANVTTNTTAVFFPWGRGNGTTTFNLPDFRGVPIAGNNNMGGVASSNLTTTYFGATNPNSTGALGGSQSRVLLTANLPPQTPAGTISGTVPTSPIAGGTTVTGPGGTDVNKPSGTSAITATFTGTAFAGQTSTAFSIVQPTRTSNYIIKITPDTNSATASGVTDIQGMTGSIACGANLTCTGNVISAATTVITVNTTPISGGTDKNDIYDNNGTIGEVTPPVFYVEKYASVAAAISAAVTANGGIVQFACKEYALGSGAIGINLNAARNVRLIGGMSLNSGGSACGAIRYTGTGTAIDITGSVGIEIAGLEIVATSADYVIRASGASQAAYARIHDNTIFGKTTATGIGISFDNIIVSSVTSNVINAYVGMRGIDSVGATHTSNVIQIEKNSFTSGNTIHLENATLWSVDKNTFTGSLSGVAYGQSAGVAGCSMVNFSNNDFDDPQAGTLLINTDCKQINSWGNVFSTMVGGTVFTLTAGADATLKSDGDYYNLNGVAVNINTGNCATMTNPRIGPLVTSVISGTAGCTNLSYVWQNTQQAGTANFGVTSIIGGRTDYLGLTSGTASVRAQAAAGTPTILWPTTGGTVATSATAPVTLNATTGVVACPTCLTSAVVTVKKQSFCPSGCTTTIAAGASGTYTPSTGMLYAVVEMCSSGGGGGAVVGTAANLFIGGGGGAGGLTRSVLTAATVGASKSILIGSIGTGGSAGANNGTAAGDTCITTSTCSSGHIVVAKGGSGGQFAQSAVQAGFAGAGGVAGTGDLVGTGAGGHSGLYYPAAGSLVFGALGAGADSPFGSGGISGASVTFGSGAAGGNATGYCAGGGGGFENSAANKAGGNGSPGIVWITEYNSQ